VNHSDKKTVPGKKWALQAISPNATFNVGNEGIFDELVVDDWLHIEQMEERCWWMRIGDADLMIHIEEDGRPCVNIQRGVHGKRYGATSHQPFSMIGTNRRKH